MAGADFLQLDPAAAPPRGLATWLTGALRAAVADGRLPIGNRLPATRALAAELEVSRGIVVQAYQRLVDEGVLAGRQGGGTVVLASVPPGVRSGVAAPSAPVPLLDPASRSSVPMLDPASRSSVDLDLSPGLPDLSAFPRAAWLRAERAVLADLTDAELGYGDPRGTPALREALVGQLARTRGVRTDPDDVLVVNGVAQGMALLAQVLRARGTRSVAFEDPGPRGTRDQLERWGLPTVRIPVDALGLDVAALAATDLDTVVVTPAHQFPTGVVLAAPRRRELLDWARAGGLVIEDDYDAEHRYDRAPVAAMHTLAPEHIVYTGSVSKTLAPALRLGWLLAPPHLRDDLVEAKRWTDITSPALGQLVLAHLITSGAFDRHLRLSRARNRRRRDAVLAALAKHLPRARLHGIAAGLHLLVSLPDLDDDAALAERALATGVVVHPLSWHRQRPGPAGLVIGYSAHPPDRLHEAIRRLGTLVPRS
ncbi:MAG: PLP-dependent aminotransferase family protein [Pseudonocardia sp.]